MQVDAGAGLAAQACLKLLPRLARQHRVLQDASSVDDARDVRRVLRDEALNGLCLGDVALHVVHTDVQSSGLLHDLRPSLRLSVADDRGARQQLDREAHGRKPGVFPVFPLGHLEQVQGEDLGERAVAAGDGDDARARHLERGGARLVVLALYLAHDISAAVQDANGVLPEGLLAEQLRGHALQALVTRLELNVDVCQMHCLLKFYPHCVAHAPQR
mmetsp:Transcript_87692/g.225964  ORF Transcript_87692/g.225964 Transcript_87692/m.225964 type:complete len:216 (+) Transcript_87692:605-1252(+)